jgi:predicted transcriptional regulator
MGKKDTPERTIDLYKQEHKASAVAKEYLKDFNRMKRSIRKALEEGPMTIPELADKLEIDNAAVTYALMSLRKYGLVTTGELDDMDEYYTYQLKKQ